MTDDTVGRRADNLDARERAAGGPEALVAGLVKGLKDLRVALKLTIVGLLLDFALTIVAGYLYVRANHNQHLIETNQHTISKNLDAQRHYNYDVCVATQENNKKFNITADAQVKFLSGFLATSATPKARADLQQFIDIFQKSKLQLHACGLKP